MVVLRKGPHITVISHRVKVLRMSAYNSLGAIEGTATSCWTKDGRAFIGKCSKPQNTKTPKSGFHKTHKRRFQYYDNLSSVVFQVE